MRSVSTSSSNDAVIYVRCSKANAKRLSDEAKAHGQSVNAYVNERLFGGTPSQYAQLETRVEALAHSHSLLTTALADSGLPGLESAITDAQALLAKEDKK